jgi:7-carboxy-7-deazaguanine synthase
MTYPLAPQAVYATLNGEGLFLGVPQVFVRLAGCPVGCPSCFHAKTRIRMADFTSKHIAAVSVGDMVLSYDVATGAFVPRPVVAVMANQAREIYRLDSTEDTQGNGTFVTGEHPFLVRDKGWVKATDLVEGDPIIHLSRAEFKRLHNPMRDPVTAAKMSATQRANGTQLSPLARMSSEEIAAQRERASVRMAARNPMKDPRVALKGFLSRKDRGKMSRLEQMVLRLGEPIGLRFTGGGDLVVGMKVPDFVFEGTNKLVEVWPKSHSEYRGRDDAWMDARRALYLAEGYEVLFVAVEDGIGKAKQAQLLQRLAEYARNGKTVRSVARITAESNTKAWVRLAGSKSSPLTVYNLEVEGTHTYVANSMVVHNCDTNYTLAERVELDDLCRRVVATATPATEWIWITGGEPTIHDLAPLTAKLHGLGFRVALATAGINPVPRGNASAVGLNGFDFVSVSPHKVDASWVLRRGEQLNIVPGLNGLKLSDLEGADVSGFAHRFVTPCDGKSETLQLCLDFVKHNPGWRLGIQAHKSWGVA